jgi:hypothetical protein
MDLTCHSALFDMNTALKISFKHFKRSIGLFLSHLTQTVLIPFELFQSPHFPCFSFISLYDQQGFANCITLNTLPLATVLYTYVSMTLQSFVRPWPLFQFLNPIHSRQESLDGGSARRKAASYKEDITNTE